MAQGNDDTLETEVIARVMEEKGVLTRLIRREDGTDPNDLEAVKKSRRYFRVKGHADFDEHQKSGGGYCSHTWHSAHAWCVMDLKGQELVLKFGQECQDCEEMVLPEFDEDALEEMAEYAADSYLRIIGKLPQPQDISDDENESMDASDDEFEHGGNPHDAQRCELCQRLGHSCWK